GDAGDLGRGEAEVGGGGGGHRHAARRPVYGGLGVGCPADEGERDEESHRVKYAKGATDARRGLAGEGRAQEVVRLRDGGAGGGRAGERVQHDEVVDGAVVARRRDAHADIPGCILDASGENPTSSDGYVKRSRPSARGWSAPPTLRHRRSPVA